MDKGKTLGGILLVAGTAIGAGMLAMPISTGVIGFPYASLLMIATFLYMLICIFILLEANLYSKKANANIISMAKESLGCCGQYVAWGAFLLLLYSASAAYISGGGSLMLSFDLVAKHLNHGVTCIIFAAIFGLVGFFGIKYIDILNRFCMFGLVASYFVLIFNVGPHIKISNLSGGNPKYIFAAIPILVLSFTSHLILPSLRSYYDNDIKRLKKVLIIGSIIPLVVYLIWEFMILGIIPQTGNFSLNSIAIANDPLAKLNDILQSKHVLALATANAGFSFFALVTSYLGVILSLSDFLADGLKIKHDLKGKLFLMTLSFIPPLFFALYYPSGFISALSYGGVFVAILFCILPVMIVWNSRYKKKLASPQYIFPGGKFGLVLAAMIGIAVIILQILATNNLLPKV